MLKRLLILSLTILLIAALAVPVFADDDDIFGDGRLDLRADAPVVTFCSLSNGLDTFLAGGGNGVSASRTDIELALARAYIDEQNVLVATGGGGTQIIATPGGRVAVLAPGYVFYVPAKACDVFTANYGGAVRVLVPAVEELLDVQVATGRGTRTNSTTQTVVISNTTNTHVVQRGENLFRIGIRYGVPYQEIAAANGLGDANSIYVGQVLVIP